jgi:hypothetical protein
MKALNIKPDVVNQTEKKFETGLVLIRTGGSFLNRTTVAKVI